MDDNNYDNKLTALLQNRVVMEISSLNPAAYNPHRHTDDDEAMVAESISDFSYLDPIIVNIRDGANTIVGGHLRLRALTRLGYERAEVITVDLEPVQEKKLNILLNHRSKYDMELLAELITDLNYNGVDVHSLGFDDKTIDQFLKSNSLGGIEDDDFSGGTLGIPTSKPGMVYHLGKHRLVCGDSTDPAIVSLLFRDELCKSCITDPPYGVDVGQKNKFLNQSDGSARIETTIENDDLLSDTGYMDFTKKWASIIPFVEPNTFYAFINGKNCLSLATALKETGLHVAELLVWVKNNHVLGRMDYLLKHEFIIYGWHGTHKFYGKQRESVFEFDKPTKNKLHPTMKPIELVAELVADGTAPGDIVYDPFGGSGTTLIACEQLGRICYMVEKDPHYCDVIRRRFDDYTSRVGSIPGAL